MDENWTEVKIEVPAAQVDLAGDIANMVVPYGIYIEDYSNLEAEAMEIAHIDLIDEALLQKDRETAVVHLYISPEENPAEAVSFLEERYTAEGISHQITCLSCVKEDWINNWKKYFKPIPVGEKLLIHPIWEDEFDAQGRVVLELEPGLAFGTGTHETTRLCLELLEKYMTPSCDFLDMGCGSGILSVAALLLGAKTAVGVDIDPLAVKTAIENAKNNHVADRFTGICGNLAEKLAGNPKVPGKFQLVAANIVADVVIQLSKDAPRFLDRNSVYIVSGIIDSREADVLAALSDTFEVIERREEKGWVAMALKLKKVEPDSPVQFESDRLLMRLCRLEDAEDIFEYAKDPDVGPNAGWTPHGSVEDTREILRRWIDQKELIFAVTLKDTGKVIGTLGIEQDGQRQGVPGVRSLGYVLSKAYWGRGLMTEAVTAAIQYAFEVLKLELLSVNHYPFNERSRRVIEKCGFHYEGTMRKATRLSDGRVLDHCCYSMTAEEYRKSKGDRVMTEKFPREAQRLMDERFGKDNVIALATADPQGPAVRYVNAFYRNKAFYVITYGLSNKMRQIRENPAVSIAGDWFTAKGTGEDLGWFNAPENAEIAKSLRAAFSEWIDNGHNDFRDKNTCILKLRLTQGVLFSHGTRYDIDFTE